MIEFKRVSVDELTPISLGYLEKAIKRTPASTSRLDITLHIARTYGDLYHVYNGELTGAVYMLIYDTPEGKVISPCLVGGKNLSRWQEDLYQFLLSELKRVNGVACRFIARKGWMKKYPSCKNIGTIYEWKP